MILLNLDTDLRDRLWGHLLPRHTKKEQAAFLVCNVESNGVTRFKPIDAVFLNQNDFREQETDYIELTDEARVDLIKRAHIASGSLVEFHSHPGPWPAGFSIADRIGLKDTVAHMRWRLRMRPYLAIVVAPTGYDALVWRRDAKIPEALAGIETAGALSVPANRSLHGWSDG